MGGCASFPKGMRAEAGEAPLPEPAKEGSAKSDTVETVEEVKIEEDKKNDDEAKQQSLGILLHEGDEKKEIIEEKKTDEEVPPKPKVEEQALTAPKEIEEVKESILQNKDKEDNKEKEEKQGKEKEKEGKKEIE